MTDLLRDGLAWLAGQRHDHMSTEVTYHRGAQSVTLRATVGRTPFDVTSDSGVSIRSESRDYIIRTADLVLGGASSLPLVGDKIHEVDGVTTYIYEVLTPGAVTGAQGERDPHYVYSDPGRLALRVHTKLVDTLTA